MELLDSYLYKKHIVYTDNYYTSLKLAKMLLSKYTNLVGTIRKTSKSFSKLDDVYLGIDENIKLVDENGIVVCRYIDKRDIYSLSTITDGNEIDSPMTRFYTTNLYTLAYNN